MKKKKKKNTTTQGKTRHFDFMGSFPPRFPHNSRTNDQICSRQYLLFVMSSSSASKQFTECDVLVDYKSPCKRGSNKLIFID